MSSIDNEPISPAGNPRAYHNTGTINLQDQLLLEALQQFIVPLGVPVVGTGSNENLRGPEAIKLVTALKEFISSVVRGAEVKAKTTIEVGLEQEVQESEPAQDVDNSDDGQELEVSTLPYIFRISHNIFNDYNSFHKCVLRQLREHVFNRMPIRLLYFVPHGSHLQILLANKEDIYAHLAPIMEDHMDDPDYRPEEHQLHPRIETSDEAATRLIEKHIKYAILSHTWLHASPGEVTYTDWTHGTFDRHSAGYQKLINFCTVAWRNHGLTLGWMDTVCINKDSSSELDESIRSMYNWYKGAKVCIVYLADTQSMPDVQCDPWFTRGWTLQELLAPTYIKFYNQDWKCLAKDDSSNDKWDWGPTSIRTQIYKATTITEDELHKIDCAPLSRKLQLAASRKVTREEDMAYSLMGIFNVSMSTAYGEGGKKAFRRLLYEILNSTKAGVLDIFNWAGARSGPSGWTMSQSQLLPSSPANYMDRSSSVPLHSISPLAPVTITHTSIDIPVLLMPTVLARHPRRKESQKAIGNYSAQLTVSMKFNWELTFTAATLLLLATEALDADDSCSIDIWHLAAVFNIGRGSRGIYLPQTCIAKLFRCREPPSQVTSAGHKDVCETEEPLVFRMNYNGQNKPDNRGDGGFWIPEDELAEHGMRFISLYL